VPLGEGLELAPSEAALRERRALDPDAHAGRLPGDAGLLRDRFGGGDDPAGDQALTALVLAREHEDRVAFGDALATVHRLLRDEHERCRPRIAHLGLDRERHPSAAESISFCAGFRRREGPRRHRTDDVGG
jgi:hypothetical protein